MAGRAGVLRRRSTQPHPIGYKLTDLLGTKGPRTGGHSLGFGETVDGGQRVVVSLPTDVGSAERAVAWAKI